MADKQAVGFERGHEGSHPPIVDGRSEGYYRIMMPSPVSVSFPDARHQTRDNTPTGGVPTYPARAPLPVSARNPLENADDDMLGHSRHGVLRKPVTWLFARVAAADHPSVARYYGGGFGLGPVPPCHSGNAGRGLSIRTVVSSLICDPAVPVVLNGDPTRFVRRVPSMRSTRGRRQCRLPLWLPARATNRFGHRRGGCRRC